CGHDGPCQQDDAGNVARLLYREAASFSQVRRQPGQVEVQGVTVAEVHQTNKQQIHRQEFSPLKAMFLVLWDSFLDCLQLQRVYRWMRGRIVAKPCQPK